MRKHHLHTGCILLFVLFAAQVSLTGATAGAAPDPVTGAEPAEGFGAKATGGLGAEEVVVATFGDLVKAINRDNVYIKVKGDIVATGNGIGKGSNITIDGGGAATLWGDRSHGQRMLELTGKNVVVKNIRLRNSGDNLSFKGPAENILVSHVSSTGSSDDGLSLSYGTKNATVQYSIIMGCTRATFIKYDSPRNITLHHNWYKVWSQRAPLITGAYNVDKRNDLNEDWCFSGAYFTGGSTGNVVNCMFVLTGATSGKKDGANAADATCTAYYSGNAYRGCSGRPSNFTSPEPLAFAPVTTQSPQEAEANVRANAGCLPRDEIDLAYITATKYPHVTMSSPWIVNIAPGQPYVATPKAKKAAAKQSEAVEGQKEGQKEGKEKSKKAKPAPKPDAGSK